MSDTEHVTALCDTGEHEKCVAKTCGCSCHVFAKRVAREHIRAMRERLEEEKK